MALFRVLWWALIFILHMRFPPGHPIATILKEQELKELEIQRGRKRDKRECEREIRKTEIKS